MRTILSASIALAAALAPVHAQQTAKKQVTFTKDVAPILEDRCQVCHRPNTFAPMSLLTYEEARPWAKSIKQKVAAREMPPWYIDKNVGRSEERRVGKECRSWLSASRSILAICARCLDARLSY